MRNTNKSCRNEAGFTIIELMIALLVLTAMIAAFVGANGAAQRSAEEMNERTVALQDANHVIEEMRTDAKNATTCPPPADNPPPCTFPAFPSNVKNRSYGTGISNLTDEAITVTHTDVATGTATGTDGVTHTYVLLKSTITVTWTSYTGRPFTETVETYLTQR